MKDCTNCVFYRFGHDMHGKETEMCMHPDQFVKMNPESKQRTWLGSDINDTYLISNPCGPYAKLFQAVPENAVKAEPKVVFFQDTKNNQTELFGKPAIRLNELINVHERYWIDQEGTVWEPLQGSWQKVEAGNWAGDSVRCFKLEEAGTSYTRLYNAINVFAPLKEHFRVNKREKHSIEPALAKVEQKPILIHGKPVIPLNKVIACDLDYFVTQAGEVFWLNGGMNYEKVQVTRIGHYAYVTINNGLHEVNVNTDFLLEDVQKFFPNATPPASSEVKKQWVIGQIVGGIVSMYHVNKPPYTDEELVKRDMEIILTKYPRAVLVKLELTDTVMREVKETFIWGKA